MQVKSSRLQEHCPRFKNISFLQSIFQWVQKDMISHNYYPPKQQYASTINTFQLNVVRLYFDESCI